MKKIPTADIKAGMILAKPVKGPSGNVLLNVGFSLQSGMSNRLQSWGIPFVYIEGDEDNSESQKTVSTVDPAKLEETLKKRFTDVLSDPIMQIIYRETFDHLVKKG